MAEGSLKGDQVCTGCATALEWPFNLSQPAYGIHLAKLKTEGLRGGWEGGRSDVICAMGIEDIVDMDVFYGCFCTGFAVLVGCGAARDARFACLARPRFTASGLPSKEKTAFCVFCRTSWYVMSKWRVSWPTHCTKNGAGHPGDWSMFHCTHLGARHEESAGICVIFGPVCCWGCASVLPLVVPCSVGCIVLVLHVCFHPMVLEVAAPCYTFYRPLIGIGTLVSRVGTPPPPPAIATATAIPLPRHLPSETAPTPHPPANHGGPLIRHCRAAPHLLRMALHHISTS